MAQALKTTSVSFGISYPCSVVATVVLWGASIGAIEARRRVSVIVALTNGRSLLSLRLGRQFRPMTSSISSWRRRWTCG